MVPRSSGRAFSQGPQVTASQSSPTADVYADDTSSPSTVDPANRGIHCFTVEADAEPGTFGRIANVLNIANIAPNRVILELQEDARTLSVYIELNVGLSTAESIQRKLAQLTDVIHVDLQMPPASEP
jgi:hypothetical protein